MIPFFGPKLQWIGEAAARGAQPLRTPQATIIRRALGLTQEEFAGRYDIPLGTLRDWEQGRNEPDQAARAYLTVIARDPEGVQQALQLKSRPTRNGIKAEREA